MGCRYVKQQLNSVLCACHKDLFLLIWQIQVCSYTERKEQGTKEEQDQEMNEKGIPQGGDIYKCCIVSRLCVCVDTSVGNELLLQGATLMTCRTGGLSKWGIRKRNRNFGQMCLAAGAVTPVIFRISVSDTVKGSLQSKKLFWNECLKSWVCCESWLSLLIYLHLLERQR